MASTSNSRNISRDQMASTSNSRNISRDQMASTSNSRNISRDQIASTSNSRNISRDQMASTSNSRNISRDQIASTSNSRDISRDQIASTSNSRNISRDQIASTSNSRHISRDQIASTSNSRNISRDQIASTSNSRNISRDQIASTSNSRHISRDQIASTSNSRNISRDQIASTSNSRHINRDQMASTSNSRDISRDQIASTSNSRHINRDQMASTSNSKPINRDQMSSTSRCGRSIARDQVTSTRSSSLPVRQNQRPSTSSSSSSLDQVAVLISKQAVTGSNTWLNLERHQFRCPVCLEVLREPVTIPCGHSYCLACIEDYWESSRRKGVATYSCPQCKHAFIHRPGLHRNTVLTELVEKLQKTEDSKWTATNNPPSPSLIGPDDVECDLIGPDDVECDLIGPDDVQCDICTVRKSRALRSCLVCLASYCHTHLRQHEDRHQNRPHRLTSPAQQHLQDKVCPRHDRLLTGFCWTDRLCVCPLCLRDRHQGHQTLSASAGRTETQTQLEEGLRRGRQRLNERERELQHIIKSIKRGAQAAVQSGERVFDQLQRCIETRRCEVMELIREQENSALRQAQERMEKLEKANEELRWRDSELERLSHTKDHIYFLQRCPNLPKSVTLPNVDLEMPPSHWIRAVRRALEDIQKRLQELCYRELTKIADLIGDQSSIEETSPSPASVSQSDTSDAPQPITRADFLHYCSSLMLDVNTANPYLLISEGRREATTQGDPLPYPDHPDRFSRWAQTRWH
ncbi:hypothetical protein DPEC_G00053620 [Dallia pectoralis]|uniref:Uncharacterized protein n=1 Tax=Dallia pectoralis TaxID=75939 RepID=A0ACC2H514_DALPE|nr:hypothetical protein DPEC_G00053620 [Dallia pectoralis]